MSTQLITVNEETKKQLALRQIDDTTFKVLQETVFPNASPESILMAIDYCKARSLDVLKKPVHIVPIWNKDKNKMVDAIWQGIAEIRTTAMRTAQYAGIDEAIYGEKITEKIGLKSVTYPEFAQVTVYRLVAGQRVPFVGDKVFWKETFAKIKDGSPNQMWETRPFGQIAKCAEASALRKAFPEEIGNDYIAEEMEHKSIDPKELLPRGEIQSAFVLKQPEAKPEQPVIDAEVVEEPIEGEEVERYYEEDEPTPDGDGDAQASLLKCSECGKFISEKIYAYSMDKFGKTLCYNCQKLV